MPTALRVLALTVAFVLELVNLVLVWLWADRAQVLVAVGAVVALGLLWGLFAAPRASRPLDGAARAVFVTLWFGAGAVALWFVAAPLWAALYAAVLVGNSALLRATGGRPSAPPAVQPQRPHVRE